MSSSTRVARIHRLRTRLRDEASVELARRGVRVTAIERQVDAVHAAADRVRREAAAGSGAALVLAWAWADELTRRAMGLLDDRARAVTDAEYARETLYDRRRAEEQLARLACRAAARAAEDEGRARERQSDELALWAHGRTR